MKVIVFSLAVFFLNSFVFAQDINPNLALTGVVKEIAAQEIYPNSKSAFFIVYIKANLKLTNNSHLPIIFLQSHPFVKNAEILKSEQNAEILLAENLNERISSSSMMTRDEWKNLKASLDKSAPPKEITRVIAPKESIEFEGFIRLNIPKFEDQQPTAFKKISTLDFIQKQSPALLKIECETWYTLSLIEKSTDKKKADFADKLRKKWKDIGYLWTDEIKAEPILIDFNSLVFKKLID